MSSSIDSNYETPDKENENVLRNLGKDVELQTFKTNAVHEDEAIVILCVGTIIGKENVFVKEHFRRTPPKGSCLPPVCMDIHFKKVKSSQSEVDALSIIGPDPEGYAGFNFQSCHGALVFWAPEHPSSLIEAAKWTKSIADFANSRSPCVLVAFNSASVEWMGKGQTIESEAALELFCRSHGLVRWFEMKSRGWDGKVFEEALSFLLDKIKTD